MIITVTIMSTSSSKSTATPATKKPTIVQASTKNTTLEHIIATVTLGLLCGWYFFLLLFLYPVLIYYIFMHRSLIAGTLMVLFITLSVIPLKHKPWEAFMYSGWFRICRNYFGFTYDVSSVAMKDGQKYLYCEFPHAIFPMGQFLSASLIKDAFPGHMICGTGADVVFSFPVMRHVMAWLGTRRATRAGIKDILKHNQHVAIIPGGIAEMYIVSEEEEAIYLRARHKTLKLAIQEGLHLIPTFFFGNSKLFKLVGGNIERSSGGGKDKGGQKDSSDSCDKNKTSGEKCDGSSSANDSDKKPKLRESLLAKISRKLRMSIVFFYGRFGLPIPYQHPLHMVCGEAIEVKQEDNPSDETVQALMDRLVGAVQELYEQRKPEWEKRPLVVL